MTSDGDADGLELALTVMKFLPSCRIIPATQAEYENSASNECVYLLRDFLTNVLNHGDKMSYTDMTMYFDQKSQAIVASFMPGKDESQYKLRKTTILAADKIFRNFSEVATKYKYSINIKSIRLMMVIVSLVFSIMGSLNLELESERASNMILNVFLKVMASIRRDETFHTFDLYNMQSCFQEVDDEDSDIDEESNENDFTVQSGYEIFRFLRYVERILKRCQGATLPEDYLLYILDRYMANFLQFCEIISEDDWSDYAYSAVADSIFELMFTIDRLFQCGLAPAIFAEHIIVPLHCHAFGYVKKKKPDIQWCATPFDIQSNDILNDYVQHTLDGSLQSYMIEIIGRAKKELKIDQNISHASDIVPPFREVSESDDASMKTIKKVYDPFVNHTRCIYQDERECLRFERFGLTHIYKRLTGNFLGHSYSMHFRSVLDSIRDDLQNMLKMFVFKMQEYFCETSTDFFTFTE